MCHNRNFFIDVAPLTSEQDISVGNEETVSIMGIGTIRDMASYDRQRVNHEMNHALFVPDVMTDLLYDSKLRHAGFCVSFDTTSAGADIVL